MARATHIGARRRPRLTFVSDELFTRARKTFERAEQLHCTHRFDRRSRSGGRLRRARDLAPCFDTQRERLWLEQSCSMPANSAVKSRKRHGLLRLRGTAIARPKPSSAARATRRRRPRRPATMRATIKNISLERRPRCDALNATPQGHVALQRCARPSKYQFRATPSMRRMRQHGSARTTEHSKSTSRRALDAMHAPRCLRERQETHLALDPVARGEIGRRGEFGFVYGGLPPRSGTLQHGQRGSPIARDRCRFAVETRDQKGGSASLRQKLDRALGASITVGPWR